MSKVGAAGWSSTYTCLSRSPQHKLHKVLLGESQTSMGLNKNLYLMRDVGDGRAGVEQEGSLPSEPKTQELQ